MDVSIAFSRVFELSSSLKLENKQTFKLVNLRRFVCVFTPNLLYFFTIFPQRTFSYFIVHY